MKQIAIQKVFLLLFLLGTHNLAMGQIPNFPYSLTLFQDVLPVLNDSSKAVIGVNHRLNDYEGFDGNVVQLGLRTKPFYGKKNFLSKMEAGLLVNGYFHQKFYWVHLNYGYGAILDQATAGHEVILFFNQKINVQNIEVNVAIAPRANLIYGNSIDRHPNGRYYYDSKYIRDPKNYFGWVGTINIKIKNIEGWASYQHNVVEQDYIEWGPSPWENSRNYLLNPSKTYFFKTGLNWTRHTLYNIKYGIAWNSNLCGGKIRMYSFANCYYVGGGLVYTKKRLSINPEYSTFPSFLSQYQKITGHQFGAILSYSLGKGFVPHYSLQFSKATDFSPLRSNLGLQYQF